MGSIEPEIKDQTTQSQIFVDWFHFHLHSLNTFIPREVSLPWPVRTASTILP